MSATSSIPACIVCGAETRLQLGLGKQPLANALLSHRDDAYSSFPLGLVSCSNCSHGQLNHFVAPEELFKTYLYASGTGRALQPYFEWFAEALAKSLDPGARVLEVACNDGSLLDCLRSHGLKCCGVDPAANLTEVAQAKGHDVRTGFFPECRPEGLFDAIVAMNVCAHTPAPRALMRGIKEALAPNGAAIVQTSQAFMLANGEFDTIYHEHYSFFTPTSMSRLAESCGLKVEQMKIVTVHGGSLLCILRHDSEHLGRFEFSGGPPFERPWPQDASGMFSSRMSVAEADAVYRTFGSRAQDVMKSARERIACEQSQGVPIALVGVAAKAMTFITAAGIKPDYFLDEAVLKVGRYVPGSSRPIEPMQVAADLPDDTLFVVGAWNFADQLSAKIRAMRPHRPSRIIVCLPELRDIN